MSDIVIKLTIDAAQLNTALADVRNKLTDVGAKKVDINTDAAETKIKSLRDNIAMWGLAIQGAVNAFQMVGRAVDSFLKPALEAEAGMTRVRAAVESTGMAAGFTAEQLAEMASQMQEAFALDDDQIMNEITTPLLTFTKITGEAFEQAQVAVANLARTMDGDLKGAALQIGKALNDPTIGLTALQKSGVSFTEQQKEMIKGMWEAGDAAGAQAEILKELNKEFGGQAAAYAESYAGKIESMKLAWGDLVQALGEGLLPILAKVAGALGDVIKWFTSLNGITKAAIIVTPLLTVAWHALSASAIGAALASGGLGAALGVVSGALATARLAVTAFFTSIGPVGWAILGLGAAVTALGLILDHNKKKLNENEEAAARLKASMDEVRDSATSEAEVFRTLINKLLELKRSGDQSNTTKNTMKGLITDINAKYGTLLGNLDLERSSYDQIAVAANKAAGAIMQKKLAEGMGRILDDQADKVAALRREYNDLVPVYKALSAERDKIYQRDKHAAMGPFALRLIQIKRQIDAFEEVKNKYRAALQEYAEVTDEYLAEMAKLDQNLPEAPGKTPPAEGSGAGGRATAPSADTARAVSEYEALMNDLVALEQTATEKLDAEWARRYGIIVAYTEEDSAERKEALRLLGEWDLAEWNKIADAEEAVLAEQERTRQEAQARLGANTAEYYNEVKFLDSGYYEWKKGQIDDEVQALGLSTAQAQLLLDQRKGALEAEKEAWDTKDQVEMQKRLREALEATSAAHQQYYEQVTFADKGYYEWKKVQIELEVAALKLSEDAHRRLLKVKMDLLEAEKAAYEALPVEEIRTRYDRFKSSMADSSEIGVAAWDSITAGLKGFRAELAEFADKPGVNELLLQIDKEIDQARERSSNKGNWFWHVLLGFDPDKAADQAKIQRIKDTFADLQSQVSNILSMLSSQNQARWAEDIAALEEKAEKEKWSDAEVADARLKIDKKYEDESRKIRNAQKAMSITQAIINTAEAVTKALTLGPILGPIMAGAITALGAVQIGLIASQKFASGGMFRGKGGPRDDQNMIMVSDGEYIVNAQSTKRYKPVLDAINYGSTHATAQPRLGFADGGIAGGGSGMLDAVLRKMDAINMNMSKLETQVAVIVNAPDVDVQVEKHERAKARLQRNGKAFSYGV